MMLVRLGYALAPLARALRRLRGSALTLEGGGALVTEAGSALIEE